MKKIMKRVYILVLLIMLFGVTQGKAETCQKTLDAINLCKKGEVFDKAGGDFLTKTNMHLIREKGANGTVPDCVSNWGGESSCTFQDVNFDTVQKYTFWKYKTVNHYTYCRNSRQLTGVSSSNTNFYCLNTFVLDSKNAEIDNMFNAGLIEILKNGNVNGFDERKNAITTIAVRIWDQLFGRGAETKDNMLTIQNYIIAQWLRQATGKAEVLAFLQHAQIVKNGDFDAVINKYSNVSYPCFTNESDKVDSTEEAGDYYKDCAKLTKDDQWVISGIISVLNNAAVKANESRIVANYKVNDAVGKLVENGYENTHLIEMKNFGEDGEFFISNFECVDKCENVTFTFSILDRNGKALIEKDITEEELEKQNLLLYGKDIIQLVVKANYETIDKCPTGDTKYNLSIKYKDETLGGSVAAEISTEKTHKDFQSFYTLIYKDDSEDGCYHDAKVESSFNFGCDDCEVKAEQCIKNDDDAACNYVKTENCCKTIEEKAKTNTDYKKYFEENFGGTCEAPKEPEEEPEEPEEPSGCKTIVTNDLCEQPGENNETNIYIKEGVETNSICNAATEVNKVKTNVMDCVINKSDIVGNSYEAEDILTNKYCSVWCKEDYHIKLPGDQNVNSGRYFTLKAGINGTKTCYTSPIDYDQFETDIKASSRRVIDKYNTYQMVKAFSEGKAEPTVIGQLANIIPSFGVKTSFVDAQKAAGALCASVKGGCLLPKAPDYDSYFRSVTFEAKGYEGGKVGFEETIKLGFQGLNVQDISDLVSEGISVPDVSSVQDLKSFGRYVMDLYDNTLNKGVSLGQNNVVVCMPTIGSSNKVTCYYASGFSTCTDISCMSQDGISPEKFFNSRKISATLKDLNDEIGTTIKKEEYYDNQKIANTKELLEDVIEDAVGNLGGTIWDEAKKTNSKIKDTIDEIYKFFNIDNRSFNEIINEYNACTRWIINYDYDPKLEFEYNESYFEPGKTVNVMDESNKLYTDYKLDICTANTNADKNDKYYDSCTGEWKGELDQVFPKIENSFKIYTCTDQNTCALTPIRISEARRVKQSIKVSEDYITPTQFASFYPTTSVVSFSPKEDFKNDEKVNRIENGLPVSLNTKAGAYPFKIFIKDLGDFYNSKELGRIWDVPTKDDEEAIPYVVSKALEENSKCVRNNDFNNNKVGDLSLKKDANGNWIHVCSYNVNCPDCPSYCEPDECEFPNKCPGNECPVTCDDCIYNSGKINISSRPISLGNVNNAIGGLLDDPKTGFNWQKNPTTKVGVKAIATIGEIESDGEKIYDENLLSQKNEVKNDYALTVTMDPGLISAIKGYNQGKTYLDDTLECYDYGDYQNVFCYSTFIDEMLENHGKKFKFTKTRLNKEERNKFKDVGKDITSGYWEPWNMVTTIGFKTSNIGPSWK